MIGKSRRRLVGGKNARDSPRARYNAHFKPASARRASSELGDRSDIQAFGRLPKLLPTGGEETAE
jgi:hypothetical protein